MSTTVIQYVLKYIQKYWLNVAKINSLEEKKQSQKKQQQQQQQKQKAWFSKPRTNYRDRSKLPQRFCPTISCIIEFPAILLIYIWYLKQSPILICRY